MYILNNIMAKEIEYKKQGDGRDSWKITNEENGECYMVYEDPNKKPTPEVDVLGLLQKLSTEELTVLKQFLK